MLDFRAGWRSFKEGLDKKLIWAYWLAVKEHAWEILWGAGVVGIPFGLLTLYYAPSRAFLGWLFVWVVLVAGYYAWRADHVRLQQRICISKVITQKWQNAHTGRDAVAYYLEVVNNSEASTIHGVRVQLSEIIPEVENLNWLPVLLHQKHDNPTLPKDYAKDFALNPGEIKHIDFVSAWSGDEHFTIHHIVGQGVNNLVPNASHHRLKVMVTAQDIPALFVWFDVWVNGVGLLQCDMQDT